jgi:hypothetical protein
VESMVITLTCGDIPICDVVVLFQFFSFGRTEKSSDRARWNV